VSRHDVSVGHDRRNAMLGACATMTLPEYVQGLIVRVGARRKILSYEQITDMSLATEAVHMMG
jgi:hypothetical protein